MNKRLIYIISIICMIGIVIYCVRWYGVATSIKTDEVAEQITNEQEETGLKEEVAEEVIQETAEEVKNEPIFTIDNYPKVDASLAIHPLVDSIAADFMGLDESQLDFTYTETRTSEVYHNLIDKKVDVIFAAEIDPDDAQYAKDMGVELEIIPATSSAFVFIVNTDNPVEDISFENIQKIYSGEITNWKELGGEDREIIPYQRPKGSGSQTAMLSLVMKDKEIIDPPVEHVQGNMGELIDAVAQYDNAENAIGFSYFYYVNTMYRQETIKMLSVDGVMPTIETIKNGEYPIYTNGFIVRRAEENEAVDKWIEAVLSERGSKIIEDAGYVPVN